MLAIFLFELHRFLIIQKTFFWSIEFQLNQVFTVFSILIIDWQDKKKTPTPSGHYTD
jgi:hypothetical protein